MGVSLNRTYFMSIDVWREYGFTDQNVDPKKMRPIIYMVQRKVVEPIIGTTLYNKLVTDIEADSVTGLYQTLLNDYIIPLMIPCCDLKATFHTTYQITNKTTGKNQDQHIQANTQDENNDLRNELSDDAEAFEWKLKGWLCDNWEDIPELYESVDEDLRAQTMEARLRNDNDLGGFIGII